jgi:hypothetical protein
MSGLQTLEAIRDGDVPRPGKGDLLDMRITLV